MADNNWNVLSKVYEKIFATLYAETQTIPASSSLTGEEVVGKLHYIKTFQSRFYPVRGGELEHDSLYPYLFLTFVEQSSEELHAMPNIVQFDSMLGIVVMQYNDGDVNLQNSKYTAIDGNVDQSYSTGQVGYKKVTDGTGFIENNSTKKGIVEIVEDVKSLLYNKHKDERFGIQGVDWFFDGVVNPTSTSLQPLLLSPYIEAKQINIQVRVIEDRNYQQLGDVIS